MSNGTLYGEPSPYPPNRRVIGLSVVGVANTSSTQCNYVRTVLCDDGTIWENDDTHPEWQLVKPIPQEHLP